MPVLLYSISEPWKINPFFPGKNVVHKICVKNVFCIEKTKTRKIKSFSNRKKSKMKKAQHFSNKSYEKSPVMKLIIFFLVSVLFKGHSTQLLIREIFFSLSLGESESSYEKTYVFLHLFSSLWTRGRQFMMERQIVYLCRRENSSFCRVHLCCLH